MNERDKFFFIQGFVHGKLVGQKDASNDEIIVATTELAIAYVSKSGVEKAISKHAGEYT